PNTDATCASTAEPTSEETANYPTQHTPAPTANHLTHHVKPEAPNQNGRELFSCNKGGTCESTQTTVLLLRRKDNDGEGHCQTNTGRRKELRGTVRRVPSGTTQKRTSPV